MARTPRQQINRIYRRILDSLDDAESRKTLRFLGAWTIEKIVERTRSEKGLNKLGPDAIIKPLKKLSPKYIRFRQQHKKELDTANTTPEKSNLTFTGQMLKAMKMQVRRGEVRIGPSGRRNDGKRNADVARWVQVARPFNSLSKGEQRKLVGVFERHYGHLLKENDLI